MFYAPNMQPGICFGLPIHVFSLLCSVIHNKIVDLPKFHTHCGLAAYERLTHCVFVM